MIPRVRLLLLIAGFGIACSNATQAKTNHGLELDSGYLIPDLIPAELVSDKLPGELAPGVIPFKLEGSRGAERHAGGTAHLFVYNPGKDPVAIEKIRVDGVSVQELHKQRMAAWWRVRPDLVPAGGLSEVVVRLQKVTTPDVTVELVTGKGGEPLRVVLPAARPRLRIASAAFEQDLKKIYLLIETRPGYVGEYEPVRGITRVYLDGVDVTHHCDMRGFFKGVAPVVINLPDPLAEGSFHILKATNTKGDEAACEVRAWKSFFEIGIFGCDNWPELQRLNFNTFQCFGKYSKEALDKADAHGMKVWAPYFPGRKFYFYDNLDLEPVRKSIEEVKGHPALFAYMLEDEPDCFDWQFARRYDHWFILDLEEETMVEKLTLHEFSHHMQECVIETWKENAWHEVARMGADQLAAFKSQGGHRSIEIPVGATATRRIRILIPRSLDDGPGLREIEINDGLRGPAFVSCSGRGGLGPGEATGEADGVRLSVSWDRQAYDRGPRWGEFRLHNNAGAREALYRDQCEARSADWQSIRVALSGLEPNRPCKLRWYHYNADVWPKGWARVAAYHDRAGDGWDKADPLLFETGSIDCLQDPIKVGHTDFSVTANAAGEIHLSTGPHSKGDAYQVLNGFEILNEGNPIRFDLDVESGPTQEGEITPLEATASASSRQGTWFGTPGDEADKAIDGKLETHWRAGASNPEWVGATAMEQVERIRYQAELDPKTPSLVLTDNTYTPNNWFTYGPLADIFDTDPYLFPTLGEESDYKSVYRRTLIASRASRPFACFATLWMGWGTSNCRCFTAAEQRIMAYHALGAGARGINYFIYDGHPAGVMAGVRFFPEGPEREEAQKAADALWNGLGPLNRQLGHAGSWLVCGYPVAAVEGASEGLWARTILSARDALVVVVVNEQYTATGEAFEQEPIPSGHVKVSLPSWIRGKKVSEITPDGLKKLKFRNQAQTVTIPLTDVREGKLLLLR